MSSRNSLLSLACLDSLCEILISSFTQMIQCWLLLSGLFKLSPVKGLPCEGQLKPAINKEPE
ncbi:hypothetical protein M9458_027126, partial [Cirrhinus mrigala]